MVFFSKVYFFIIEAPWYLLYIYMRIICNACYVARMEHNAVVNGIGCVVRARVCSCLPLCSCVWGCKGVRERDLI